MGITPSVPSLRNTYVYELPELLTVELSKGTTPLSNLPAVRKDVRRYVTPPAPAPKFTGRLDVLGQMEQFFNPSTSSSSPDVDRQREQRIFVLYGLGGVGKSQIAYRFLEKHRER